MLQLRWNNGFMMIDVLLGFLIFASIAYAIHNTLGQSNKHLRRQQQHTIHLHEAQNDLETWLSNTPIEQPAKSQAKNFDTQFIELILTLPSGQKIHTLKKK